MSIVIRIKIQMPHSEKRIRTIKTDLTELGLSEAKTIQILQPQTNGDVSYYVNRELFTCHIWIMQTYGDGKLWFYESPSWYHSQQMCVVSVASDQSPEVHVPELLYKEGGGGCGKMVLLILK